MAEPEELGLDSIIPDLEKKFNVTITEHLMDSFAELSGDTNPLHTDDDYACSTRFGKRVVYGMLLNSFLSRLIGMHLPGKKALYLSQDSRFRKPAFIGDILQVSGKVKDVNKDLRLITLKTKITKQDGALVLDGIAKVSILD